MGKNINTDLPVIDVQKCAGKVVLVRVDFNVPFFNGMIQDRGRLLAVAPTLKALTEAGAKVVLLSHLGRPKGFDLKLSLKVLMDPLREIYGSQLIFVEGDPKTAIHALQQGHMLLLENLRFDPREEANDPAYAKYLASLGDIYVNDAFAVSHRAHASVEGITHFLLSFAGYLLRDEVCGIGAALNGAQKPVIGVLGGSKISTKLKLVQSLAQTCDVIALMGGLSHTFLKALGHNVGASRIEEDMLLEAKGIVDDLSSKGHTLILPQDFYGQAGDQGDVRLIELGHVQGEDIIYDIGPKTLKKLSAYLDQSRTLIWNGPLGFFEQPPYDQGTFGFLEMVAKRHQKSDFYSLSGGGETLSVIRQKGYESAFSYLSTGGGAFLEFLEDGTLPGIQALMEQKTCGHNKDDSCQLMKSS